MDPGSSVLMFILIVFMILIVIGLFQIAEPLQKIAKAFEKENGGDDNEDKKLLIPTNRISQIANSKVVKLSEFKKRA